MDLASLSVKRPVLAVVMSLMILLFGVIGFKMLGIREYPSIDPPIINVKTSYVGANAEVVESQITEPLERALNGIEGVRTLTSSSNLGSSSITVEFELSADMERAANDVRDKVSQASRNLPKDLDAPPVVSKADANSDFILMLTLQSESHSDLWLSDFAQSNLVEKFQTMPGVSAAQVLGERKLAMRIIMDPTKMLAYGISFGDVQNALAKENVELPSGKLIGKNTELSIRTLGKLKNQKDFSELVLRSQNNKIVMLQDIAEIRLGAENEENAFRRNGINMVGMSITPMPGANALEIAKEFYKRLAIVQKELPKGLSLEVALDNTRFIKRSVTEVAETLALSVGLVIAILFLFFREPGLALRPLVDLPVSLIGTFFVMYLCGFSINMLTLLAIVLATGLVVDDGIVVAENIFSKIEKGMNSIQAAIQGTREIFAAVISTSITLASVFLPLLFLPGFVGKLFREFAIVLSSAVLISAFVSLTLTPMLSARLLGKKQKHTRFYLWTEPFFVGLDRNYRDVLSKFLRRPWIAFVVLLLCGGIIFAIKPLLPSELAPLEDRSLLRVTLTAPEGSSFEYTDRFVQKLTERIRDSVPEKRFVIGLTAPGFTGTGAVNTGMLRVMLPEPSQRERSQQQIADQLGQMAKKSGDGKVVVIQEQTISVGGGSRNAMPVQFILQNASNDKLKQFLPRFLELAQKDPTFAMVDVNLKFNKPELQVQIERDKAHSLGLSVLDISKQLQLAYSGSRLDYFEQDGKQYSVIGQLNFDWRQNPQNLLDLTIRNSTGQAIPLANVLNIQESFNPPQIYHYNRLPSATISAALAPGKTLGEGIASMQKIAQQELDESFSTSLGGSARDMAESSSSLLFAFGLALLLIYLILAAQFESFKDPLVVMFTIPMALAGAFFSLWYFNQTLNLFSQIGMILLIGLVTKNGILLVEFARQLRHQGQAPIEAVLNASSARLRPILMTSLATVLGAMPIALGLGAGAASRMGMGIVVVGGLIFSLILTLFVIPAMDLLMHRQATNSPTIAPEVHNA